LPIPTETLSPFRKKDVLFSSQKCKTTQFKKDIKKQIRKRGKDPEKLTRLVRILLGGQPLPEAAKDHPLIGVWKGRRDCHVEPDWVLIYKKTVNEIRLERTGTHSDLL
jgi:mRNA interferase YafQ